MRKRKSSGFTLIEIMIAMFIFSMLMAALLLILTVGKSSMQVGSARIDLQQELRRSMDWISDELRQAGSSVITGVPADGAPRNTISFQIPDTPSVTEGSIAWEPTVIQYSLGGINGEQLLRTFGAQQTILANNITSFELTRQTLTPAIVEIALQSQKRTVKGHLINLDLDFQIKLRN